MAALTSRIREVTRVLTERHGQRLAAGMDAVAADYLPAMHRFADGLRNDRAAVVTG